MTAAQPVAQSGTQYDAPSVGQARVSPRAERHVVSSLTVLYDANCPVCRTARAWVDRQHQLVPVTFVAAGTTPAQRRFPGLDPAATLNDITAVDNTGAVYRGDHAWLIVLWSLRRTRRLALDLAQNRRRWVFRNVVNATDLIRRLSKANGDVNPRPVPPLRASGPNQPTIYRPGPSGAAAPTCDRCHQ